MEKQNEAVPEELLIEILSRMPLKALLKCICVSKKWASIIRGKHFKDLYFVRSKTRPRVLFALCRQEQDPTPDLLFHSVYQDKEPLLSSGQQQMRISNEPLYNISAPIRGLISFKSGGKAVICNPGIKKLWTSPEFEEHKVSLITSFFGYDEDTDAFKVLCMTRRDSDRSYPFFTVGLGEESWRPVACKHLDHCPNTNAICERGVLYYGAWVGPDNKDVLMSFNVRSEELAVVELPEGVKIEHNATLVSYNGHVALVNDPVSELYHNGVIQMLVWDEIAGEWREERFVIPRWRETVGDMMFYFEGTTIGTGELVFTQDGLLDDERSFFVVYYDAATRNLRKFRVKGGDEGSYYFIRTFLNHVDSLLLV